MKNTKKIHYELDHFYPGFDCQKFFDLFVNNEIWTESEFLPEVRIIKPGKDHPMGLGAVRFLLSGRMKIKEEIVGFQSPEYFSYATQNGSMPVNDFGGKLFLEGNNNGVYIKYHGSFNPKYFGTGWIFKRIFSSAQKSAFENLGKAYKAYYNT